MKVEFKPEPEPAERAAILAALALEDDAPEPPVSFADADEDE